VDCVGPGMRRNRQEIDDELERTGDALDEIGVEFETRTLEEAEDFVFEVFELLER